MSNVNKKQVDIMRHAYGLQDDGVRRCDRNHFVTADDSSDGVQCVALCGMGLMKRFDGNSMTGGDALFKLTPEGIARVIELTPRKKLTRSQRRYEDFLRADSGLTFLEWLKQRPKEPSK